MTFHLPSSRQLVDLRKFIKWVILIQIWFRQMIWVLYAKGKTWEKTHFDIFGLTGCELSTSRPKFSNPNILVSAHLIGKLKIVPEISRPREYMMKNPFLYFECFTSENPCDSSTSLRANFYPETLEKFLKHGFSFFYPNLPFSLESRSMWHIGCLIYKTPHPASNNHLDLELKNFLSHEEELVFEKIRSVESILSQFFFQFQFHIQI